MGILEKIKDLHEKLDIEEGLSVNDLVELNESINHVAVYNIKGQLINSQKLAKGTHSMELKKSGVYYLEINYSNKIPLIIY